MSGERKPRARISGAPPVLSPIDRAGADAFVSSAPVTVSAPVSAPVVSEEIEAPAVKKAGRPRKYEKPLKPLTVRVSLECYEDLRFLEYVLRKGSIQDIAAELLTKAASRLAKSEQGNQK